MPNAREISTNINATNSWMLRKVTFVSNFLPNQAPTMAAKVAQIRSTRFSCRLAAVKREA